MGKGLLYAGLVNRKSRESVVLTLIYRKDNYPYIRRCRISSFILNRGYSLVPEDGVIVRLSTRENVAVLIDFEHKNSGSGINRFPIHNYLRARRFKSARFVSQRKP